ncbi:serine/threonine-protein kinase [Coleofasciculus sp. FACHB-1120]|uniref:serine/threonine protein kinase n=1 Tax=Coleofasciculus sp. FACHB-1120 TaxID=2692783 RepID=UPI0016896AAD|nr:serine/threonine-protein kinase [Coleofasciculus sp. FACHB-1120]MBD2741663.1 serine/threonine protein kinase [Coleofasciculus sp. FACHB-1120]
MKGEVLGDRYQIEQQLGKRELGKRAGRRTLLVRDQKTQQLVVVKILTFGNDFEWDDLKLFEREAETLKSLTHPAIPRYLDYFELNSPNYKGFALVQTYVEGKSLEEHLKGGRTFSEADIKQITTTSLEILNYLHSRQPPVIHRDIKPSNILLTNRSGNTVGEVYLVDFGAVQTLAAKEGGTITVVGTYGYMPPEQFGGRAVPASDLYSLGATLIYLATGQHPADLPQTDNLQIEFEKAANLSPAFINWLKRMTHPSLNRRLASASEALQALKQEHPTTDSFTPIVKKPTGSKISLTKNADFIKISIPPKGFTASTIACTFIGWSLLAIAWNSFMIIWTNGILFHPSVIGFFLLLLALPFWYGGVTLIWHIFVTLFGRLQLYCNQQQISLTWEIFGFKFQHPRPALRQDINRLVYIPKHHKKDIDGDRVDVPGKIIIKAGLRQYELNGEIGSIHELELDWLAHELSEWLEIPITRDYLPPSDK